jgi:hypothetical protein
MSDDSAEFKNLQDVPDHGSPDLTDDDFRVYAFDEPTPEDFELEKVIVVTQCLGRSVGLGWGSQALALVDARATYPCPNNCGEILTHVCIGSLDYEAEIERHWASDQCLVNLVAEHHCPHFEKDWL